MNEVIVYKLINKTPAIFEIFRNLWRFLYTNYYFLCLEMKSLTESAGIFQCDPNLKAYDGRGYDCGKAGWYKIANDIKEYLKKFMPSSVISTHIIFPGRREKNDLFNEI